MRTRQQHQYDYAGLTTGEFAKRTGQSAEQVRGLIDAGWFQWFRVEASGIRMPECLDVSSPGSRRPSYRIHPRAVDRFFDERSASGKRSA